MIAELHTKMKMAKWNFYLLHVIALSVLVTIAGCQETTNDTSAQSGDAELDTRSVHRASSKATHRFTNKKLYLKRFAQSWKYYAKANDIAKREKLRKALLDALKSMNSKKKNKMTSLSNDSVKRIRHAAHMLREFKRMYKLSNDVLSTWKDYNSARKSLIDIGKTKEGGDILKKYVILREKISNNIKRSEIPRPSIVDDQDIDESIAKDNIARHGEVLKEGGLIVQRAMTPGTLQIIRTPAKHSAAGAQKRMNLFSDAKEAARTAYSKAKEAINALKEKLKGVASVESKDKVGAEQAVNETNDEGTNKKSLLAENDEMKGQSLGHVNAEMALTGMIRKAGQEDLAKINQHAGTNNIPHEQGATSLQKADKGQLKPKGIENRNEKAANESFHAILSGSANGKEKVAVQKKETATKAAASLSSLMDSLAGAEDGLEKSANSFIKSTNDTAKPLNEEAGGKVENNSRAVNTNPLFLDSSGNRKVNMTGVNGVAGTMVNNQTYAKVSNMNGTVNVTPAGNNTERQVESGGTKEAKLVAISSHTTEQKFIKVSSTPLGGQVSNGSTVQKENVPFDKTKSNVTLGTKRFQLNDLKIQQQAVKTIDRQLETLKRLQEAKRARKRYDTAKHELQDKIKKLYDMAVSFEKPINDVLMSTKTNIDPNPTGDDHPGAALAGISDKAVNVVKTPSDDSEHHGFTLGVMDSSALGKAHVVDIDEEREKPVAKVYQIGLGKDDVGAERKSQNGDQALRSLTDAIKNDLNKIEMNQFEQVKAKKHSDEIKKALEPLISEIGTVKDKNEGVVDESEANEKPSKGAAPQVGLQALADKKDKEAKSTPASGDESVAKAQDAFKEVEDYLSKALKHVAKEAISEDESSSKDTDLKESSGVVKEDSKASGRVKGVKSPTERVQVTNPLPSSEGSKENEGKGSEKSSQGNNEKKEDTKDSEKDKDKKEEKDMDKNERLRKIVEDAMKEHAKDPKNPHPINADLLKPTSKVLEEAKKQGDLSKKDEKKPADQKVSPTTGSSAEAAGDGTIQRSPNDAIGKAEHLEEQVAQLQDKLYSQGTQNDAYKTIDNVEDKPLFSQDANPGEQQPTYQDHVHHHSHRRHHHSPYEETEEEEQENPYSRDGSDRGYDDDDGDDDGYDDDDDDQRDDYDDDDDEEDRKKKSFLQPYSWRRPLPYRNYRNYRNYQRDRITSKQTQQQQPQAVQKPLMNQGMMGNDDRDELEDMKKSTVPKLAARQKIFGITKRGKDMYIL